jgi:hypothetical protein
MARSLWEGVDVRLIDRPANWLAAASFKMATGLSKVVTLNKSDEPLVTFVLLRLLVLIILLLVLAEEIEDYFLG